MLKTIIKVCEKCKTEFEGSLKEHNRGGARFCSQSCASKRPRGEKVPNCVCANAECRKPFYRSESRIINARSGFLFCSRTCKELCQRIGGVSEIKEIQPHHYGVGEDAYRKKAFNIYDHKCIDCDYSNPKILEVHHLDGDRTNSFDSNLVIICPTHHRERHAKIRDNINYCGELVLFKEGIGGPPRN